MLGLGLASSMGCAGRGYSYRGEPRQVNIPSGDALLPVDWWCDFAIVQVFIEKQGPFNFLLDTGSDVTVVTPKIASLFSKQVFQIQRTVLGSGGHKVAVKRALSVQLLEAGTLRLHQFDANILDLSMLSDAMGMVLDGILGCPLFDGTLLRIDYPNREVRVLVGTLVGTKRKDQFHISGAHRPFVGVTLSTETHPVLVDTGSNGGLSLVENVFEKQTFREAPVVASTSIGISGKLHSRKAGRLVGLASIGPHRFNAPIVETSDKRSTLGVKALRHFIVTYDRKHGLVRLEREKHTNIEMEALRTTGVGLRRKSSGWSIMQIFPYAGKVAQKLQPGDAVINIAGRPIAELDCHALEELIATQDVIDLEIERQAKKLIVKLPVIELVP